MKKFLLSCFLALSIGASAQYSYIGDFENPGYSATIYKQFGGGSQFTGAACNGDNGGRLLTTAAISSTGYMVDLTTIGQTGNGQKVDFSVGYKKASGVAGTLQLAYFVYDSVSALWSVNLVGSPVTLTSAALTTCSTLTATLPAGTVQPDAIVGVGAWFVRSGTDNGSIYLDDINIIQDASVTGAPTCTTITSPGDGSTISAGTAKMIWDSVPTAVNYKVTVGTTLGGSEIFNGTVNGTMLNLSLAKSIMYYAKVVPSNVNGDAVDCSGISFSTDNNIAYCGGITSTTPAATYPLSSVTLNGITNTSAATVGAPAYEDFTSRVFSVKAGVSYSITAIGTGLGANMFGMTVFVDWNEDGDFNDANERYFQGPLVTGTGNPINLSGSIAVPAGTTVGTKRMRVKYNFQGTSTTPQSALADPCSNMTNGQTEDYSVAVSLVTNAPLCTIITAPANNATAVPTNAIMTWAAASEVSGYKLYIGTTSGGTDVANGTVVTGSSYQLSLLPFTDYYAKVVPYNTIGDAAGPCTEIMFTTGAISYCAPTPGYSSVEPTTNVTFAGIDNTTSAEVGATPAYEQFLNQIAQVRRSGTYTISMNANTDGASFRHFFAVFFDWNQDGDFDDAGEQYFTNVPDFKFVLGSDGVNGTSVIGNIVIPADAKLGQTRMRVKSAFYGASGPNTNPNLANFANGCSTTGSSYGQIEDYTVNVDVSAATSNIGKKSKISIYPNPFQDVLKISDMKGVKAISVSDVSGRQVKNLKPSAELNLSDLKTGLYIVTLQMEDGTIQSFKAIKK